MLNRIFVCVMAMCLLAMPVGAQEDVFLVTDELKQFETPLSGLLAVLLTDGVPYPQDVPDDEYMNRFVFYLANILQQTDPAIEPSEEEETIDRVVPVSKEQVFELFRLSFADVSALDTFVPDEEIVHASGDEYVIEIGDDYRLTVEYAGTENPRYAPDASYPFTYTLLLSDGLSRAGTIQVRIGVRDDAFDEYPLYIADFSVEITDSEERSVFGNWRAKGVGWFSLMEGGLIYLFDADDQLLENGEFSLDGAVLTVTFPSGTYQGTYDGDAISLSYGDETSMYLREVLY